jgi:hypothetical protein
LSLTGTLASPTAIRDSGRQRGPSPPLGTDNKRRQAANKLKKGPLAGASGPSLGRKRPRRAAVTRLNELPHRKTCHRGAQKARGADLITIPCRQRQPSDFNTAAGAADAPDWSAGAQDAVAQRVAWISASAVNLRAPPLRTEAGCPGERHEAAIGRCCPAASIAPPRLIATPVNATLRDDNGRSPVGHCAQSAPITTSTPADDSVARADIVHRRRQHVGRSPLSSMLSARPLPEADGSCRSAQSTFPAARTRA